MSCEIFTQDPLDKRQLSIDYSSWLGTSKISGVSWTVEPGLTLQSPSFSDTVATAYFSGGTDGEEYSVACTIETDDATARNKTQRVLIRVEQGC